MNLRKWRGLGNNYLGRDHVDGVDVGVVDDFVGVVDVGPDGIIRILLGHFISLVPVTQNYPIFIALPHMCT